MPTGGFGDWTKAQVERHRGETLETIPDAWNALPNDIGDAPPSFAALSFDVVTQELDINHALGIVGDGSSASVRLGAASARDRMCSMLIDGEDPAFWRRPKTEPVTSREPRRPSSLKRRTIHLCV